MIRAEHIGVINICCFVSFILPKTDSGATNKVRKETKVARSMLSSLYG